MHRRSIFSGVWLGRCRHVQDRARGADPAGCQCRGAQDRPSGHGSPARGPDARPPSPGTFPVQPRAVAIAPFGSCHTCWSDDSRSIPPRHRPSRSSDTAQDHWVRRSRPSTNRTAGICSPVESLYQGHERRNSSPGFVARTDASWNCPREKPSNQALTQDLERNASHDRSTRMTADR